MIASMINSQPSLAEVVFLHQLAIVVSTFYLYLYLSELNFYAYKSVNETLYTFNDMYVYCSNGA